jgi:hypothetical protein
VHSIAIAPRDPRRGSAVLGALALLLVLLAALGGNYVRNYQIDQVQENQKRPYAKYRSADLDALAEGYRMELRRAEQRQGAGRVQARERFHFAEQVKEFERVQKEARRSREKTLDLAQMRADLAAVEAEQKQRLGAKEGLSLHLDRMLRI